LRELVSRGLMEQLEHTVLAPGELAALAARIEAREIDPYSAAAEVVARRGTMNA
jgi:hypothetical protein